MKRHILYDIDLQNQTAFCTVCGQTQIHILKSRADGSPKAMCITRARDKWFKQQDANKLARQERHLRNPQHRLYDIDPETKRAFCYICGPTDLWICTRQGLIHYSCGTKMRDYMRK